MKLANALTVKSRGGRLRALHSKVAICLPLGSEKPDKIEDIENIGEFNGVWDTGASGSVITKEVADKLSLSPTGQKEVGTANGKMTTNTYIVDFILPGNVLIQNTEVTEGKLNDIDILIGMDIITLGDFAITNKDNNTVMSFRIPSMAFYDYVPDANNHNIREKFKEARKSKKINHNKKKKKKKR